MGTSPLAKGHSASGKTGLAGAVVELLRLTATDLPRDVEDALEAASLAEENDLPRSVLAVTLEDVRVARAENRPICQDTGIPIFFVTAARGAVYDDIAGTLSDAVRTATREIPLRPNAVDPLTGRNSGTGVGAGIPVIYFTTWDRDYDVIDLILKGGGSENVGATYKLPDAAIGAERDADGVRRAVLDAVFKAQGRACPPYVVAVGIAGTKDDAVVLSKRQLLRSLRDRNESEAVASLEGRLLAEINSLGIGPAGLSGRSTALAVKVGVHARHPATFFVDVSFGCWAHRRRRLIWSGGNATFE